MLLSAHMKDPPDPGTLFPSLAGRTGVQPDADDDSIFMQVAASLTPYK
jgi:hypothetical protein